MKNQLRIAAAVALLVVSASVLARHSHHKGQSIDPDAPYLTVQLHDVAASVAFSPRGQGQQLVVDAITGAKSQVLVQAYGFSNTAILKALAEAKARGVDVKIILDKSNDKGKYSGATYVANAGIPVWIDYKPSIAHNKVIVIDNQSVITGSFNFTAAAQEHNAENVLFLQNVPTLAAVYIKDWNWRQSESYVYPRK
jgi:phosphatidylserine/phosphatidylglycerophosphate/cardiolipin synthase-like enzyme